MGKIRKKIPTKLEVELLYKSHHMCSICNIERKGVHIHHIDGDTENYADDNLIVLCTDCHDQVEKEGKLTRKFKKDELRKYRFDWEEKVKIKYQPTSEGTHLEEIERLGSILEKAIDYKLFQHRLVSKHIVKKYGSSSKLIKNKTESKSDKKRYTDLDFIYMMGYDLLKEENFKKAIIVFEYILKTDPTHSISTLSNLGTAFSKIKKYDKGISCFKKALKVEPNNIGLLYNLTLVLQKANRIKSAILCLDKILKLVPNDVDSLAHKGHLLEKLGKNKDALLYYDIALRSNQNDTHVLHHKGMLLQKMGRYQLAFLQFENIVKHNRKDPHSLYHMGVLKCQLNEHVIALSYFKKAVKIVPKDDNLQYSNGLELEHLGLHEDAMLCYEKSLKINPNSVQSLHALGSLFCEKKNKHGNALSLFKKSLKLKPNSDTLYSVALELSHLKKYDDSLSLYDKVLKINPNHVSSLINKANILLEILHKPIDALSLYEKALKIEPDHIIGLTNKGHTLVVLKKFDDALIFYDKSLSINHTYDSALYGKARVKAIQGDKETALDLLTQSIVEDSQNKDHAKNDESFANIKDDERFTRLVN